MCKGNTSSHAFIKKWSFIMASKAQEANMILSFFFFIFFSLKTVALIWVRREFEKQKPEEPPSVFSETHAYLVKFCYCRSSLSYTRGCVTWMQCSLFFRFDKRSRLILDLVSSVHWFTFRRWTEAGHRTDRPCTPCESTLRISSIWAIPAPPRLLLKKAQLASIGRTDYHKGTPRWFFPLFTSPTSIARPQNCFCS